MLPSPPCVAHVGRGQGEGAKEKTIIHPMALASKTRKIGIARALRQRQTPSEGRLWSRLRQRRFHGYKFRRQHAIGHFIVDFICLECKVIVELDGEMHALKTDSDYQRDRILEEEGYLVLRFRNVQFKEMPEWCLSRILMALERARG